MKSKATTVETYLSELPDERREDFRAVRELVLKHLPDGYEEVMRWGMITYEVPLATCSETYNGQPLMYAGLSSEKKHMSLASNGHLCFRRNPQGF